MMPNYDVIYPCLVVKKVNHVTPCTQLNLITSNESDFFVSSIHGA